MRDVTILTGILVLMVATTVGSATVAGNGGTLSADADPKHSVLGTAAETPSASITFDNQTTDGSEVTVARLNTSVESIVQVYDADGDFRGNPGTRFVGVSTDVRINLESNLTTSQEMEVRLYHCQNGTETSCDGPQIASDTAMVRVSESTSPSTGEAANALPAETATSGTTESAPASTTVPKDSSDGPLGGVFGQAVIAGSFQRLLLVGTGGLLVVSMVDGVWYRRRGAGGGGTATGSTGGDRSSSPGASSPSGTGSSASGTTSVSAADHWGGADPPDSVLTGPDVSIDYASLTDEELIGAGGNADVSRATLSTDDGEFLVGVKKPRMGGTLHTDAVDRLLDEAETWAKLDDHDHIVDVVDYGSEPLPWIAMEYMDGGHLGERAGELDFQQALWTALAVTEGVYHAHRRGVAHLDLKPENVLFRSVEDGWDVPKVADWGLSQHLLEHSKSVEGMSPQYAAPEQFDGDRGNADDITDVYQLGAVFYELFTGQPPFEGKPTTVMRAVLEEKPTPPTEVNPALPEALDAILLRALAKDKADRYDDIVYLRDALREIESELEEEDR